MNQVLYYSNKTNTKTYLKRQSTTIRLKSPLEPFIRNSKISPSKAGTEVREGLGCFDGRKKGRSVKPIICTKVPSG